jgi:DNA invertase Pin-like site-specific DNA recombinase
MNFSEHITTRHLSLKAAIYIRQSTPGQVKNNQESRQLQLALKDRAIQFGWPSESIEILDADLGITGTNTVDREGIQYLMAQVARGEVGVIFCYEVSRLMRNCTDWFPLLDICSYKRTLIGDKDGLYDPRTPNGRLILGFKGQLAEIELNTIRGRMYEGLMNKAKRGDLIRQLPTGFVCLHRGVISKDPNVEIQHCIKNIFDMFLKLKSAAKVLKFFNGNHLKIPRYKNKELNWKKPTVAAILSILKNPAYAGASVYGKTETFSDDIKSEKKKVKKIPMEQWKYVVKDKFPPYITWETFETIQNMLKDNHAEYNRNKTRGVPRPGKALLHGIMYCGCCSHKMVVQYKNGTQYICNAIRQQHGTPVCQYIPADPVDGYVVEAFFQALSPIEINAYEKIVEEQWYQVSAVNKMREQQIERLRYQVKLAERQFNQVDPDNRLVALELERRWENALKELKEAQSDQEFDLSKHESKLSKLPSDLKNAFTNLGKELPNVWKNISQEHKKSFLRCLIDKVVVHRKERNCLQVRIVWVGGETTTTEVLIPIKRFADLAFAKELEEKIVELAKLGQNDQAIAEFLTKEGYRSAATPQLLASTVQTIRLKHGILRRKSPLKTRQKPGFITVPQLAKRLGVVPHLIYHKIKNGSIVAEKDPKTGLYLIPDNPETEKIFLN